MFSSCIFLLQILHINSGVWIEAWSAKNVLKPEPNIHFVVFILTISKCNSMQVKTYSGDKNKVMKRKESKTIRFNHYRIFFTEIIKSDSSKIMKKKKK